jgi:hypothetical protein
VPVPSAALADTDHPDVKPPPSNPAAATTPADPLQTSVADEIVKLASLHEKGMLTDDEFAAFKSKLMG